MHCKKRPIVQLELCILDRHCHEIRGLPLVRVEKLLFRVQSLGCRESLLLGQLYHRTVELQEVLHWVGRAVLCIKEFCKVIHRVPKVPFVKTRLINLFIRVHLAYLLNFRWRNEIFSWLRSCLRWNYVYKIWIFLHYVFVKS